jgi:hypothetical protein
MEYLNNSDWEVLTEDGWKDFSGIKKTTRNKYHKVTFSDDSILECTPEHKIKLNDGFNETVNINECDITSNGLKILNNEIIKETDNFFDLINVDGGNEYFTNNVISHNCGFIDKGLWEDFWKSTYPVISSSKEAQILISSTPKGLNHFWKLWSEAENGKNGYSFLKVLWFDVPGRDEKWKEDTLKELNGDIEFFLQEFECVWGESKIEILDSETGEKSFLTMEELEILLQT